MITIMGATGNTGGKIARGLLGDGHHVRALGRSEVGLAPLREAGAETFAGDTSDPGFLARAFEGARAAYTLLPTDQRAPDYPGRQREEGEAIARAILTSGIRHVVALSSVGAELSTGTGVIAGLYQQEQRLRRLDNVNLHILRPVSFFENFVAQLEVIEHEGIVADSVEGDLAIPMVATKDIAAAAVESLANPVWTGIKVSELAGPRDISFREATRILGERLGTPDLPYVQLPYDEMANALVQAGLSASFAEAYVEMTHGFNENRVKLLHGRTAANTTPTTFEEFAGDLVRELVPA